MGSLEEDTFFEPGGEEEGDVETKKEGRLGDWWRRQAVVFMPKLEASVEGYETAYDESPGQEGEGYYV